MHRQSDGKASVCRDLFSRSRSFACSWQCVVNAQFVVAELLRQCRRVLHFHLLARIEIPRMHDVLVNLVGVEHHRRLLVLNGEVRAERLRCSNGARHCHRLFIHCIGPLQRV